MLIFLIHLTQEFLQQYWLFHLFFNFFSSSDIWFICFIIFSVHTDCFHFYIIFQTATQFFFKTLHRSPVSWDMTPLYFFRWNFILFYTQKEPIKLQIWWNQNSEIWDFDGLLFSKQYKVSDKKAQKSYISWHWRVIQSWRKTDL